MAYSLRVNKSARRVLSALNNQTLRAFLLLGGGGLYSTLYRLYFLPLIWYMNTEGVKVACCQVREYGNRVHRKGKLLFDNQLYVFQSQSRDLAALLGSWIAK